MGHTNSSFVTVYILYIYYIDTIVILNEGGTIMCKQDVVQVNLRLPKWLKHELQSESKHINISLHAHLINILVQREIKDK